MTSRTACRSGDRARFKTVRTFFRGWGGGGRGAREEAGGSEAPFGGGPFWWGP